jgi:hypothetical protein
MSANGQIVLKKSFRGDEQNFLEALMRFTRGDVKGPYRFVQNPAQERRLDIRCAAATDGRALK